MYKKPTQIWYDKSQVHYRIHLWYLRLQLIFFTFPFYGFPTFFFSSRFKALSGISNLTNDILTLWFHLGFLSKFIGFFEGDGHQVSANTTMFHSNDSRRTKVHRRNHILHRHILLSPSKMGSKVTKYMWLIFYSNHFVLGITVFSSSRVISIKLMQILGCVIQMIQDGLKFTGDSIFLIIKC